MCRAKLLRNSTSGVGSMKSLAQFVFGRLYRVFLCAALACFCIASLQAAETPAPQFSRSLFDGQSLQGWTAENGCEVRVNDGLLVLSAGDGWLRSDHTYADFVLHVEWKALKKSEYDAGIYIRTPHAGKPFPGDGYQINLLEGKEGNI